MIMQVREIQYDNDGNIRCPICGKSWLPQEEIEPSPCKHLQFIWHEDSDLQPFNGFNSRAYLDQYIEVYRENEDDDLLNDGDIEISPDDGILKKTPCNQIDEILEATQSGMACGPVWFTSYFGVKR